ncbi:sigma-54 interaction domain-containing protein [Brevibacillus porteri]|uniref:Transcriptional regulator n=1 Tax=Brevibacillus porteri TaxID=2126350 RepID=A0ABX5FKU1_9BACL|nr:sigma 54-interacting transcriptional regulator [Brevibacillus porteri]MED1799836.1 sigma 54-interacting transcriptional regulator [Brevibacillus porteri]MED2132860.1 sigma 54-interacting transcriptional regulator [Brevibacillus porteri]MED2744227.1 sigma 54-interacting transcriptional regulator [Brevibacillus porteri]MED2816733.1 sigma 54-interacting transcriptional regulator [Brevibacillus porteri]MED2894307.1 sigma 54-interacting transcriptional regulator [Brevibacillus porteri]
MVSLDLCKPAIEKVITSISDILNVDAAVINERGLLVVSTERYLKQKGENVHVPSIEFVLAKGQYVVDKPGSMEMCKGCRFLDSCPAKVELLSSIKVANHAIGVVSLTSFTKEGQNRLSKHTERYQQILTQVSEMITAIVQSHATRQIESSDDSMRLLEGALDTVADAYFTFDRSGNVIHTNASARRLLSQHELLPAEVSRMLLPSLSGMAAHSLPIANCLVDKLDAPTEATPIIVNNQLIGGVLRVQRGPLTVPRLLDHQGSRSSGKVDSLAQIVGNSAAIKQVKEMAMKIGNSSSTVLITGETGTGKGHLAKAIHEASTRAYYPFVAINCASIPENLFESELFGYEDGAFTGAKKGGKPGRFEMAEGGTLFLDEIGDMPLSLQAKLLRVLQEKVVERIGSTRSFPINVRIIAATNQNLEELVEKKAFRADLYYRLNVIPIHVPSLAERKEDIELLAVSFMEKYGEQAGRTFFGIAREAINLLTHYHWPGNVRELENAIEYAMNMEQDTVLTVDSLPPRLRARPLMAPSPSGPAIKARVADAQAEAIRASLQKHGSDLKGKQRVAEELGIGLRTLYRKLKLLGI